MKAAIDKAQRFPHKNVHIGVLSLGPNVFASPDRETNLVISPYCILDCTGSIFIGPWSNIGHRCRIYTHDTIHLGKRPLARIEEQFGVLWQDKYIGADVWVHDDAMVLYQANYLPDGFVLGAGSVLTKNPEPYEIWAGVPAKKIGEREDIDDADLEKRLNQNQFLLEQIDLPTQPYHGI